MKTSLILTAAAFAAFSASALAGETTSDVSKNAVPSPPAPALVFGTGWYFGLQAGINAYQDFGGSREFSVGGSRGRIDNDTQIGFVGGIKAGYVFGTGVVRPAIEADLYYNGVHGDLDVSVNGSDADISGDVKLNSGAFMGNFLLRFAYDRFQPYIGAGAGAWVAQVDDIDVTVNGSDYDLGSESSSSGFAWQIIGGADYYFTEKVSAFLEYKFLNYEDAGIQGDRIGQHLVVLGVRLHF
jgi:opacity protein-like surface antigen